MRTTGVFGLALAILLLCGGCADRPLPQPPSLALTAWAPAGPPKAVVVAVHGRNSDHTAFAAPAAVWARDGILTYAYDQRSLLAVDGPFGVSALADDLDNVLARVHARNPHAPLFIVGESMGASVAILAVSRSRSPPVAGVVLSAPAIWPDSDSAATTQDLLQVTADLFDSRGLHSWAGLVALMETAAERAPALDGRRVLLLYGQRDSVVPRRGIDRLTRRLGPAAQFMLLPDDGHMVFRSPAHSQLVADWIIATGERPASSGPGTSGLQASAQ